MKIFFEDSSYDLYTTTEATTLHGDKTSGIAEEIKAAKLNEVNHFDTFGSCFC